MFEWIRFGIAALFVITGLFVVAMAVIGNYRFKYVLNRMHAAAKSDSLGVTLIVVGLIIIEGFTFTSLKLVFVLVLYMLASPVTSHLVCKMEVTVNDALKDECEVTEE